MRRCWCVSRCTWIPRIMPFWKPSLRPVLTPRRKPSPKTSSAPKIISIITIPLQGSNVLSVLVNQGTPIYLCLLFYHTIQSLVNIVKKPLRKGVNSKQNPPYRRVLFLLCRRSWLLCPNSLCLWLVYSLFLRLYFFERKSEVKEKC